MIEFFVCFSPSYLLPGFWDVLTFVLFIGHCYFWLFFDFFVFILCMLELVCLLEILMSNQLIFAIPPVVRKAEYKLFSIFLQQNAIYHIVLSGWQIRRRASWLDST